MTTQVKQKQSSKKKKQPTKKSTKKTETQTQQQSLVVNVSTASNSQQSQKPSMFKSHVLQNTRQAPFATSTANQQQTELNKTILTALTSLGSKQQQPSFVQIPQQTPPSVSMASATTQIKKQTATKAAKQTKSQSMQTQTMQDISPQESKALQQISQMSVDAIESFKQRFKEQAASSSSYGTPMQLDLQQKDNKVELKQPKAGQSKSKSKSKSKLVKTEEPKPQLSSSTDRIESTSLFPAEQTELLLNAEEVIKDVVKGYQDLSKLRGKHGTCSKYVE